jgi:hypothetical protein
MNKIEIKHKINVHLNEMDGLLEQLEPAKAFDYVKQIIDHFNFIKAGLDPENEHNPHHDN